MLDDDSSKLIHSKIQDFVFMAADMNIEFHWTMGAQPRFILICMHLKNKQRVTTIVE